MGACAFVALSGLDHDETVVQESGSAPDQDKMAADIWASLGGKHKKAPSLEGDGKGPLPPAPHLHHHAWRHHARHHHQDAEMMGMNKGKAAAKAAAKKGAKKAKAQKKKAAKAKKAAKKAVKKAKAKAKAAAKKAKKKAAAAKKKAKKAAKKAKKKAKKQAKKAKKKAAKPAAGGAAGCHKLSGTPFSLCGGGPGGKGAKKRLRAKKLRMKKKAKALKKKMKKKAKRVKAALKKQKERNGKRKAKETAQKSKNLKRLVAQRRQIKYDRKRSNQLKKLNHAKDKMFKTEIHALKRLAIPKNHNEEEDALILNKVTKLKDDSAGLDKEESEDGLDEEFNEEASPASD